MHILIKEAKLYQKAHTPVGVNECVSIHPLKLRIFDTISNACEMVPFHISEDLRSRTQNVSLLTTLL